jgi:plasmid stabilization system protein ParE
MKITYTDRSKDDLEVAFEWYEKQRRGLGFDFLDCVEASIINIISFPEMFQEVYSNFRRCIVRRFPFSIFYTIGNDEIVVHAIFNNHLDPVKQPK